MLLLLAGTGVTANAQAGVPTRAGAGGTEADVDGRGSPLRLVVRADAFLARVDAAHIGLGATRDLGSYVRLDGVVAAGLREGGNRGASARAEIIGRFLLDPFRQARWGVYAGGGLIARHDEAARSRGYVTLLVGAELPGSGQVLPAVEVGIGGGTRIGLVIRRGRPNRR